MKIRSEHLARGQRDNLRGVAGPRRHARAVQRTVERARLLSDVLHNVDLAALRPAGGIYVIAQHPECWPYSLPARNFYARFKSAIRLREEPLCFQTRRGV